MRFRRGFTLIEMLAAIGAVSLILPAVFAIFISILKEQARFIALKHIKAEGENVLYQMKDTIKTRAIGTCKRNLDGTFDCTSSCITGDNQDQFFFRDPDGHLFRYFLENEKVASESIYLSDTKKGYLTSDLVKVEGPNLVTCTELGNSTLVNINLTLKFAKSFEGFTPKMKYSTKVRLISR